MQAGRPRNRRSVRPANPRPSIKTKVEGMFGVGAQRCTQRNWDTAFPAFRGHRRSAGEGAPGGSPPWPPGVAPRLLVSNDTSRIRGCRVTQASRISALTSALEWRSCSMPSLSRHLMRATVTPFLEVIEAPAKLGRVANVKHRCHAVSIAAATDVRNARLAGVVSAYRCRRGDQGSLTHVQRS